MESNQPKTYGEQLVGLTFNPSGDDDVAEVKRLIAKAVDIVRNRTTAGDSIHGKLVERASEDLLAGQMMAVKAITWKGDESPRQ